MNQQLVAALNLDRIQTAAAILSRTFSIADLQPLIDRDPGAVDTILRSLDLASVATCRRHTPTLVRMANRTGGAAMRVLAECDSHTRARRALASICTNLVKH